MSSGNPEQERAREKRAESAWAISPGLPWEFAAQFAAEEVALAVAEEREKILRDLASALKKFAPRAVDIIMAKIVEEKEGYEEFLAFLRK